MLIQDIIYAEDIQEGHIIDNECVESVTVGEAFVNVQTAFSQYMYEIGRLVFIQREA